MLSRNSHSSSPLSCFLLITAFITGCHPTVKSAIPEGAALPMSIAVLPPDYSADIPRERVDLVHAAVSNELRNKNFVVVEGKVVSSTCSTAACPERSKISERFLVDGFATITLNSFSRNNFIAGYYNQLQGTVAVSDAKGKELISVAHTENESGGVLLQSGQLFQGIISQVKHSGDAVFEDLAERFAKSVVEKLPAPEISTKTAQPEGMELALTSASAEWQSPTAYSVCAQGTPHSFAYLVLGKTRTSLREVKPGSYCGTFSALVTSPAQGIEAIELRTAYGNSIRRDISIPAEPPCDLKDRLASATAAKINILCASVGSDNSNRNKGCSPAVPLCQADRFLVYKAADPAGPYQKVSEQRSSSIPVPQTGDTVAILAVSRGGVTSQPTSVSGKR